MSQQYQCPHCKVVFETEETVDGSRVDCPECGKEFVAVPLSAMSTEEKRKRSIGFLEAWKRKWTRWSWHGRASRAEYWWAILAYSLECVAVLALEAASERYDLNVLYYWGSFIPMNCLQARRLHDSGITGKWVWGPWVGLILIMCGAAHEKENLFLIGLWVAIIGTLALLVVSLLPGNKGSNKYGEEPV